MAGPRCSLGAHAELVCLGQGGGQAAGGERSSNFVPGLFSLCRNRLWNEKGAGAQRPLVASFGAFALMLEGFPGTSYFNFLFFFLIVVKTHDRKFIIVTILSVQLSIVTYIHIVVQSTSGSFSSCKTETLYPLNTNSPFLPSAGNSHSTLCVYDFDCSG